MSNKEDTASEPIDPGEKIKEILSKIDPTIDWSKVDLVSSGKGSFAHLSSNDSDTQAQILRAYETLTGKKPDKFTPG